ncbi:MAG: nucleotide sugar dehydrogenase [Verrucomicrobiota bacterium]
MTGTIEANSAQAAATPTDGKIAKTLKVGIIGMGYVGLPLGLQFARSGVRVMGFDIDPKKAETLNRGGSYIEHIPAEAVAEQVQGGRFGATTMFSRVSEMDAVLIAVPTPLNKNREPDISYVLKSGEAIAPHIQKGTVIVLESTTYPGTTDTDLRKVLEEGSGLTAGKDFHLAYSPEREDPGNPNSKVAIIPKVVGGLTEECQRKAAEVYATAIQTIVPVSSCRAAEATKLLENIFRSVNIALVNELKTVYHEMGIDVWEVIDAAKTKPFGYMAFYPGPGLGGHCIPIDPFYLTWKAREYEQNTRFIELAGEVNTSMPNYVVSRTIEALNSVKKPVNGSRILLIGLAYKPDVDDDRESPSYRLLDLFSERGAELDYFDPHVPAIRPSREYSHWAGKECVQWTPDSIGSYDAVVIATGHKRVNYEELAAWAPLVVDTRNALIGIDGNPGQFWKA